MGSTSVDLSVRIVELGLSEIVAGHFVHESAWLEDFGFIVVL